VRTLAGDRLTTEQLLKNPSALGSALGDAHPYTRAVRLLLAATLEARRAAADASALRDQAEMAGRALIAVTGDLTPGVPAPPGVVAHLAPNPPEREGFRRRPDGSFFTPLTSTQRLLAGRDGWRLHVIVSGTCRASIVIGNVPHLIALHASRSADGSWETRVGGTAPPQTMRLEAAERPRISVVADGAGGVEVRWPEGRVTPLRMDHEAVAPDPPYSMTFSGDNGAAGCDLVWLEIPFPLEPRS
jgi:hypothetical protein